MTSDIEDKIKYKLKTVREGREYLLEVKNRSTKEGSFRGKLIVKTNSQKKPEITFSVYGKVQKEVITRPKSISFGKIDTTKENFAVRPLVKTVRIVKLRGDGLTIKKVKTSKDWIVTESKTEKEGKQYSIIVTLDKDKLPKGKFEESIKVRTNNSRKYLEVKIKGEVI